MNKNLSSIFETSLHDLADWDVFRRGESYYRDGAVAGWRISDEVNNVLTIEGVVSGTEEYETKFKYDLDEYEIISARCSCPYGLGCKHLVALGMHVSKLLKEFVKDVATKIDLSLSEEILGSLIVEYVQNGYSSDRKLVVTESMSSIKKSAGRFTDVESRVVMKGESSVLNEKIANERADLVKKLEDMGLLVEALDNDIIEKLLVAKRKVAEKTFSATPEADSNKPVFGGVVERSAFARPFGRQLIESVIKPKIEKPKLAEYYIRLDDELTPGLYYKNSYYMSASVKNALKEPGLSDSQVELLKSIKERTFDSEINKERNILKLVELIQKSGMLVSVGHSYGEVKPVKFVIENSIKLKGKISLWTCAYYDESVKQEFIFSMPVEYWKGSDTYSQIFSRAGDHVAHITAKQVTLYPMPGRLSELIARVGFNYSDDYDSGFVEKETGTKEKYQAVLTGEEVWRYDEIIQLLPKHLELTEMPPKYELIRSSKAAKAFVIDYNTSEQTLSIMASIDYGSLKQDVGESVYISMSGGVKHYAMREYWNEDKTHRIAVENNFIRIAKVDERTEKDFYKEIREISETLGFSKSLKCSLEGQSKIIKYLKSYWLELAKYADSHKYPIIFVKDKLHYEEACFHADFDIDLDAANDWLHFDMDCYCGRDKLTLPQIMQFIETGENVFQREDGTFVEISNREELERLVTMLKSFEAQENGFEGRLYHAAELEYVATSSKHYTAVRAKGFDDFMKNARDGKPVKSVQIPKSFDKVLRAYQKEGVHWLHFLRSFRFAGILADDMGIGKTLQALTIISSMRSKKYPSIVICPKSLLFNWRNEVETFAPELKVLIYQGNDDERKVLAKKMNKFDLVVVSYATFRKDEDRFVGKDIRFNYAVLDEAQFIKNHATKGAQIAKKINADYRLALTGTPLENNVSELWSIFDFLMPGFLGNFNDFHKRFHKPIMDSGDRLALEHLKRKVAPFMLRRTKGEVLTDLPAKIEQEVTCELGKAQNILYQQILAKVRGEVFAAVDKKGFKSAQIHILAGLTKLRQVCNHPALLLEDKGGNGWKNQESAKLDLAVELVDEAVKGGHKVLIFSQFTSMLDIIGKSFDESGFKYLYLSGKSNNRESLVKQFNEDPKIQVFLISLKAGGTGLNLTSADTVIIFDPWWNPSVEAQAADRAHRIGQKKTVNVYRLLTKGTIEDKIQILKKKKKSLSDALVDSSGDLFNKLTWEDVRGLFD